MGKPVVLPRRVDLRARLGPVCDQGERPTCLAFAITTAHELGRTSSSVKEDLSEEALYWGCKQLDKGILVGTSFTAAQRALRTYGQPDETIWPYDPGRDESLPYRLPHGVRAGGAGWHRAQLKRVGHTVASLRSELASGRLVAIGVLLTRGFHQPVADWVPEPAAEEATFGGHAVAVVGYDDDAPGAGRGGLLVRNSWGESWADEGYGWLPYRYIELLAKDAWIIGT
jgi:Papain family cysteine protease